MFFNSIPIWTLFVGTIGLVLFCLEFGVRLGMKRQHRQAAKLEVSAAMVGAMMGLLAFMLAFTFNGAAGRNDTRKVLVVDEANAIGTAWLRAGFLPEPDRTSVRGLLREYVDLRVKKAASGEELTEALKRSDALQDKMWGLAQQAGRRDPGSITVGLFVQALNEFIDLHMKRLTAGIRTRVPATLWVTLYLLIIVGMTIMGAHIGQSGIRYLGTDAGPSS
jgi:hypothetical protein